MSWWNSLTLPAEPVPLRSDDRQFLIALSALVVRCRSSVERDGRSREIEFIPDSEAPGRLARTLAQLLAAMEVIGIIPGERRRLTRKVGLDCVPALRRRALEQFMAATSTQSTSQIAAALDHPTQTVRRALEDLAAHHVITRHSQGSGKADSWELNPWTLERWESIR